MSAKDSSAADFARIGPLSKAAAEQLARTIKTLAKQPLFAKDDSFESLLDALKGWDDAGAAIVIGAVYEALSRFSDIESAQVAQWIRIHAGDPPNERAAAVKQCIETEPPEHVTIIRRLSTAGSQKLVFLAKWHTTQSEIVLKRFIRPELEKQIIARELNAHALSLKHANIIETHLLQNKENKPFLLEARLQRVLEDDWDPHGIVEAANLLHDMASALEFLQGEGLVHGDVKPANIGQEHGRYILLDFGICRRLEDFGSSGVTGSLRTRAPELLIGGDAHHGYASDVWALGASVYRGFADRFPLIHGTEKVPRIWDQAERKSFEDTLAKRAADEYEKWVTLDKVPEPLKTVLRLMLAKDPALRFSAKQTREYCRGELAAMLREHDGQSRLSPADEIAKLCLYLPDADILSFMPHYERDELKKRLELLKGKKGLPDEQGREIEKLLRRFPSE
jgi:serine/threonine protein kinase